MTISIRYLLIVCYYLCGLLPSSAAYAQTSKSFQEFSDWFVAEYQRLQVPALMLSYQENLQQMPVGQTLDNQQAFFTMAGRRIADIAYDGLSNEQQIDYQVANFEIRLNLERLRLSQGLTTSQVREHTAGIFHVNNGQQWYAYFLNRWLGAEVNPDDIFQFGLQQISKAKQNIKQIRHTSGLSKSAFDQHLQNQQFFTHKQADVQNNFEAIHETVSDHLSGQFFAYPDVPLINIARGDNPDLAQVPGYYNNQTFYYNLFTEPFNKRSSDWLYLHEAIPGHHFQLSIQQAQGHSAIRQLVRYSGFSEGWAAYTETLGESLGLYQDLYLQLGRWEWDIVRSVRVSLDVGINYYGWSDQRALLFWRQHITDQDAIGEREIQRMRRWPAQVITYKYGAAQIQNPPWASLSNQTYTAKRPGPLPLGLLGQLVLSNNNEICRPIIPSEPIELINNKPAVLSSVGK